MSLLLTCEHIPTRIDVECQQNASSTAKYFFTSHLLQRKRGPARSSARLVYHQLKRFCKQISIKRSPVCAQEFIIGNSFLQYMLQSFGVVSYNTASVAAIVYERYWPPLQSSGTNRFQWLRIKGIWRWEKRHHTSEHGRAR